MFTCIGCLNCPLKCCDMFRVILNGGLDTCTVYSLINIFQQIVQCELNAMDLNNTPFLNITNWVNSSSNVTCNNGPGGVDTSPYYQTAVYIMYCFIFLLALAGNGLVCHVVQSSPRMRTVTNYFIVNLAVGDILMTLFCVPFSSVSTLLLQYWPFGSEMCRTVSYSQVSFTLRLLGHSASVMVFHFYNLQCYWHRRQK